MRRICRKDFSLIKQWEGLCLCAYQDVACVWTIGYGHTNEAEKLFVHKGMSITEK